MGDAPPLRFNEDCGDEGGLTCNEDGRDEGRTIALVSERSGSYRLCVALGEHVSSISLLTIDGNRM